MSHHERRARYGGKLLGETTRTFPTAKWIAAKLLEDEALLGLRTRALVPAIRTRYRVSTSTAMRAVGFARRGQ